ncbi:Hypothetical predicted protein [Podarcis lilfordi]|uniref:SPATA31 domain-containing protein n=1 Tax=Podarcis lilfordi TaxID=74358 RepID=A0AA35L2I5_9SAUR|nr:Hypothetical predicted protein [Podarcis lilfordi]
MQEERHCLREPCFRCLWGMSTWRILNLALIFLTKRIQGGSFLRRIRLGSMWRRIFSFSVGWETAVTPASVAQEDPLERRDQPQANVDKGEGPRVRQRETVTWQLLDRTSPSISIRRLLCDNAACPLCACTATEAERLAQRSHPAGLPTSSYIERSSLPAIPVLGGRATFPRSRSNPAPNPGDLSPGLEAAPLPWKGQHPHSRKEQQEEPPCLHPRHPASSLHFQGPSSSALWPGPPHSQPHSPAAPWCKTGPGSSDDNKELEDQEDHPRTSSRPPEPSSTSSSSSLSSSPVRSQDRGRFWGLHEAPLPKQEKYETSSPSESNASSESEEEDGQGGHFLPQRRRYSHSWPLKASPGSHKHQRRKFASVDTPFMSNVARMTLELHLVVKRLQHDLGLPLSLLKTSLPPAPDPTFLGSTKREADAVTRPQDLPFVAVASSKRLKQHVKRVTFRRHQGLPRGAQRTFWHRKTVSHHMIDKISSTSTEEEGLGGVKHPRAEEPHQHAPHLISTAGGGTLQSALYSLTDPQADAMKKLFENGLEAFSEHMGDFSETASPGMRKLPLPKLIPWQRSHPQPRCGPSLGLWRKAYCVDVNIRSKYLQSYTQKVPSALELATTPPQRHPTTEFGHVEEPFLPHCAQQQLESHLARKKAEAQEDQPSLVQWSLQQFVPPPLQEPCLFPMLSWRVEGEVLPDSSLPTFITLETTRQMDGHIRSKIPERQRGLPKRVTASQQHTVRPCSPLPAETPRGLEKASESTQWERGLRQPLLAEAPSPERAPNSELQRYVAKMVLEIQLKLFDPVQHLSQAPNGHLRRPELPGLTLAQRPRSQKLPFVEQAVLDRLELNVTHKDLSRQWGLPTLYGKSLSLQLQKASAQAPSPPSSSKGAMLDFASVDTPFLSQGTREELEWHVREKKLQHFWELPGLVKRSLHSLSPDAPHLRARGHVEVTVLLADKVPFLSNATLQELERNVRKRVLLQRWCLPRRVLESLRTFYPEVGVGGGTDQRSRKMRMVVASSPWGHLRPPLLPARDTRKVTFHLGKKCAAAQLGLLPALTRPSGQSTPPSVRQPLPKLILPSQKPPQARSHFLPSQRPEDIGQIELAIQRNHLMSLWGLGTHYVEALGGVVSRPSLQPPGPERAPVFVESETLFLSVLDREALELHVNKKVIQHEWGLPGLVQRSLAGFSGGAHSPQIPHVAMVDLQIRQQGLSFLPAGVCDCLEKHIQKRKLHQQWGLPRRVLQSLRSLGLWPETAVLGEEAPRPRLPPLGRSRRKESWVEEELDVQGAGRTRAGSLPPMTQLLSTSGPKVWEKMQLPFPKKCVEFSPDVVRESCQGAPVSWRPPLLKPASQGHWTPQPRSKFLPFIRPAEVDQVELAILRNHLASLWGLDRSYVVTVGALKPKLPSRPPRDMDVEFLEEPTPFLEAQVRESLELHIRTKRIQHQWGLPGLIQKSLVGFMQRAPPPPSPQRSEVHIHVLRQEPSLLLPRNIFRSLEFHIQRLEIQRRWRLPRRVLESIRQLCPEFGSSTFGLGRAGYRKDHPHCPDCGMVPELSEVRTGMGWNTLWQGQVMDELQLHLAKKNLEVKLRDSQDFTSLPWAWAHLSPRQPLPKVIPPGFMLHQPRCSSWPHFPMGDVKQVDLAVQGRHLASLWGDMGTDDMEYLSRMVPGPFTEPLGSRKRPVIEFKEAQTLFLWDREREALEVHVMKKKLHHAWGFPGLVQKSLRAFVGDFPLLPTPQRTKVVQVHIVQQEPIFLPQEICSRLEFHMRKRNLQHQWGLPKRVAQSLQLLSSADAPVGKGLRSCLDEIWPSSGSAPVRWAVGTEQDACRRRGVASPTQNAAPPLPTLESKSLRAMWFHLAKKHMELQFGVSPAAAAAAGVSELPAHLLLGQPLPKLILAGQGTLWPRGMTMTIMPTEDIARLELAVQRCHLGGLVGDRSMTTERNKETNISDGKLHSPSEADITDDQWQGREEVSGGISRAEENEGIAAESPEEATKEEKTGAQSPQLEEWVGENPNATEAISTPHVITKGSGENTAATQTKQVTEERSSSSPQATEDVASESPQPTEEAEITEEIPQATSEEMTTVTSERPPATETEGILGAEPQDNVANGMPEATKGVGGESPQHAGNGSVVYEIPLAVEGVVAEWAPRAKEGEMSTSETQSPQSADAPCKSPPAAEDEMSVAGESQGVTAMGHAQEEEEEEEMMGRVGETGHAGEEGDNRVPPGSQEGAEEVAAAGGSPEAMEEKSSTTDMSLEAAEEGNVPRECPSSEEERHADGERPLAEKAPGATGEQPQALAPKGGEGTRGAHERPQLRERTSVKAESPPQAPGGGQVCGQSTWQDAKLHMATHPGRLAVACRWRVSEQIQDSLKLFLRHSQPRLHSYYKPLRVFGDRSLEEGKMGSRSGLQKKPQGHRTELQLQVGHGGRITSCVASSSVSPKHHPSTVTSLGGSGQERKHGGSLSRSPCFKGRALQGSPGVRFILGMSLKDPGTFREPQEEYGILPPPPPSARPKDYKQGVATTKQQPSNNQLINSLERSSLDSSVESALESCIETLLWDKEKISEWLDRSLRRMMQNRQHPVGPTPSSPSPEIATHSTCMGHTTVYQKSRTFPYGTDAHQGWQQQEEAPAMAKGAGSGSSPSPERNKTQEEPSLSFAESRVDVNLPEQEGLLKSSEGAASGLLGAHISQRTLGSFVHPSRAISPQSTYEAMVPGLGKECQERLRGQIHGGKASLGLSAAGRVGPPFQTQEDHRALFAPSEPRGWADGQRGEVGTGLKPPSPPLSVSGRSLEQQQQQHNAFLQAAEGSRKASCEGSEASGDSNQHLSSRCFLGTGEEFPAPPSDWFHSDAEETGVERMPGTSSISASEGTFLKTPPDHPPTPCPLPAEDWSPFSTERKRERARHRGSKATHSRESLARQEPCAEDDQNVGERPGAGSCPKAAKAVRRPQRETASSAKDAEKRLFLISAILEGKLNLKHGLHIWLRSQERRRVTWSGGIQPGAPTASCLEEEEEML